MNRTQPPTISRREFARRAALASAAASLVPGSVVNAGTLTPTLAQAIPAQEPPEMPKLSPESQAEVAARIQAIFGQFGTRFTEEQKVDIRRLCFLAQPSLDRMRAFNLQNGNGPALYLKPLFAREKKPATSAPAANPAETPKKS